MDVEVVSRADGEKEFRPLPFRWVAEQVNGTLMLHRRLVRDYEIKTESAESMVYWASCDIMAKRLTGENTPTWRDA